MVEIIFNFYFWQKLFQTNSLKLVQKKKQIHETIIFLLVEELQGTKKAQLICQLQIYSIFLLPKSPRRACLIIGNSGNGVNIVSAMLTKLFQSTKYF